jgi:hypothetical protein
MAVSDSSKVDLLYKKLFGVTKTDTPTNKGAGNESIASPALIRGDKVWTESASIPATAADVTNIVQSYLTTSRIECTADTTATPISGVYPTWKTNSTNWIPPEFGSTYFVKVYAEAAGNANPTNGTALSDSGAGNAGEWFFDYQSGVLNFIGGTIPAALTSSKVIYITGYRYIGSVGVTAQTTANVANTVLTLSNFTTANLAEGTNLYYTNARVNANIAQMSINVFSDVDITGITTNGTLIWNGSSFIAGTAAASDFAANANIANLVLSISNFTTSNLAEGSNLYYTNARVVSTLLPYLTTSNVAEGTNLYYTNARVYSNVISILAGNVTIGNLVTGTSVSNSYTTTGNVNAGNLNATTLVLGSATGGSLTGANLVSATNIQGNIWIGLYTANVIESSNALYYTNARVYSAIQGNLATKANVTDLTTANVAELTNQYFTNVRAVLAITPYLTTSNISEGSNLYYTNARVVSTVLPYLTTSNVAEGSNLYYTNARVISGLVGQDISVKDIYAAGNLTVQGEFTTLNVATLNIEDKNITLGKGLTTAAQADGAGISIDGAQANITYLVVGDKLEINKNVRVLGDIQANTWTGLYTSNVIENTNLFYTNTRVVSAVLPYLTTSNVAEGSNLYYTNARVYAAIEGNLATKANVSDLNTSNIAEGTNLYYTNARVYSNVITLLPTLAGEGIQIQANGQINSNVILTLATLSPFLTTSNVAEGSNLYYTNARVVSAVTPYLTTANVIETSANLYFTNARVLANVSQMSINVFADVDMTGLQTSGILIWNGSAFVAGTVSAAATSNSALFAYLADRANTAELANVANSVLSISNFTTANLVEGINLYYTNARVVSAVTPYLTTSNVIEGANLYFTNTRAAIGLTGQDISVKDLYAAGNLTVQGEFTTLNVATLDIEDKNITLGKGLTTSAQADTAGITIDGAQANITYFVTGDKFNINKNVEILGDIKANTWTGLYSGNVLESTNQFFTNARAVLAITPYLTTANVTEVNNQYFTNARVVANLQLQSINVLADVDISGINNDELLLWNSSDRVFRPSSFSNKLTTANVVELTNLYFTNARVITALSGGTANLSLYNLNTTGVLTLSSGTNDESVAGLEFSNNPAGGGGDTAKIKYFAANIGVNDDTILEISVANNLGDSINFKTMGGGVGVNVARPVAEFDVAGNINARNSLLFSTLVTGPTALFNTVTANTWNNLYTSNVIEGNNLYYTNARVLSIVTPLLTTSNVAEGSNLYYTDARVYSAIQGNLATKANVTDLTTSNVVEGTNQYFTNARVLANVSQMSINVFADVDITGVSTGYGLVWDGSKFVTLAPTSSIASANTAIFATNANVANTVLSISNFTTANLTEGTNLYFTNARVISGLVGQDVNLNNLTVAGDLVVQGNTVTLNTATLIVEDKNILLANGATNSATADGAGFNIAGAQANLTYRSTGDKFEFNKPLDVFGNVKVASAINYANTTNVTKVYQYYNESTQSLDTIFL